MLKRFSVLTMEAKVVCRIVPGMAEKYDASLGIKPWHHIVVNNGYAFVYIWDTRVVEMVIPEVCLDQNDLTYDVIDNRMDLVVNLQTSDKQVIDKCLEQKEDMPIMFIDGELTENEKSLLNPMHY